MAETKNKTDEKTENLWREYVIPLRKNVSKVPRYKRANKAIKTIKEFLARHMKISERDLNKVKLDKYLNEFIWMRGIRNPPSRIRVKVVKEKDIVRAELSELPGKLKFKKERIEKRKKKAEEAGKKKKAAKPMETSTQIQESQEKTEEQKKEESEKKAAVVEAGKQIEKAAAKQAKHQTQKTPKQPKHQVRKTLSK